MLRILAMLLAAAPLTTTVKEMRAAYLENEIAADDRFRTELIVSGKVFAVSRDVNGEPSVVLFDGVHGDWLVRCFPSSTVNLVKVKTGQRIRLTGTGTGIRQAEGFTLADLKSCDVVP